MLLTALLGWLEREQRDVIVFLREENRVLKAQLAGRRLHLNDGHGGVSRCSGSGSDAPYCETWRRLSRPTPFCDGIAN